MKPIVNPLWFYLINICGKAGGVLLASAIIFGIIAVICIGIYVCVLDDGEYKYYSDESKKMVDSTFKFGKKSVVICVVSCILLCLTPSEKACYQMVAATVVTPDNITAVGDTATDIVDYIVDSVSQITDDDDDDDTEEDDDKDIEDKDKD